MLTSLVGGIIYYDDQ